MAAQGGMTPLPTAGLAAPATAKAATTMAPLPAQSNVAFMRQPVQQYLQQKAGAPAMGMVSREQVLEQRIRELEAQLRDKDETIKDLQAALSNGGKLPANRQGSMNKVRSPGRSGGGFRKVADSKPAVKYSAVDPEDQIDVRLEEFYNSTGSAVQFKRINRGFYRFGDSIVELQIINHKLMACTEDGWNRGKFGPIEKFLMYYENIEREKAGIKQD